MTPTGHSESGTAPTRRKSRWRWLLAAIVALVVTGCVLTLSLSPIVAQPDVPDTAAVNAARNVLEPMSDDNIQRGQQVTLGLSQRELAGMAQLGSQALAPLRVQARLAPDKPAALIVEMSRPLPLGLWLNITATTRNADENGKATTAGLPDTDVTIGRLAIPQWLTHRIIAQLWAWAQDDATEPLAIDETIRRVAISARRIDLVVVHPGRAAAMAGLAKASGNAPDSQMVATAYCMLARARDTDITALIQRAWALPVPDGMTPVERNRALLTAIAMRAIPESRQRLAGAALPLITGCARQRDPVQLAGRDDLAKHWSLSAALAATLGGQVAQSLGTWKELADSSDGGTGFSFVDLAADRSGERFGAAAINPALARAVQTRLGAITEEQLMPRDLLTKPEGLDQAAFERAYSSVGSPEYRRALASIDALLDNAGVPAR